MAYVKRRIEADILPGFGPRPILVAIANRIQDCGVCDIAKRALETVRRAFHYSIAHGYSKRNPASEIRPSDILMSTRNVNYARVDARELPALLRVTAAPRSPSATTQF